MQRELQVEQAARAECRGRASGDLADLVLERRRHGRPGQHAGRVARVHAGRLDVLEHRGDPRVLAVAERVDVELERALEVAVDEHGPVTSSSPAERATCMPRPPSTWCGRTSTG